MKPLLAIALVAATLTIGTAKPASATMAAAPAIHYGETDIGIVQQVGHRYYGNRHYGYGHGYRNYGYRSYGYGHGYPNYGYRNYGYRNYGYGYQPHGYYQPYGYYRPYGYYGGYRPGLSLWFGF
jgi:hypothetical protein